MSNEIEVTIRGNAGAKPTLHEGAHGGAVARFTVAVSSRRRGEDGQFVNTEAQWFTVKAFSALGRNVAHSVERGTPVLVRGTLVTEYWKDTDGNDRTTQVLRANSVGIELHNGIASYVKMVRNSPLAEANEIGPAAAVNVTDLDEVKEAESECDELPEAELATSPF